MALMLNMFYFIIFCSIYCVKSKKHEQKGNCPDDHKFQSPINIRKECAPTIKTEFPALQLEDFNSLTDITITNNGHTLISKSKQAQSASIRDGPLKNVYNFVQLHFHWGSNDNVGSEHQIDSKTFPMEGHFVFSRSYKKNTNPNMKDGTNKIKSTISCNVEAETEKRTNLNGNRCDKSKKRSTYSETDLSSNQNVNINVVLGVLFVESQNATVYKLLEKANDVVEVNRTIEVKGDYISQFVSSMNLNNYFTYSGSLTTPPYSTNVIWLVLRDPLFVSSKQLALLRKLKSDGHGLITENFREIQVLHDRVVCCRKDGTNS